MAGKQRPDWLKHAAPGDLPGASEINHLSYYLGRYGQRFAIS